MILDQIDKFQETYPVKKIFIDWFYTYKEI